MMDSQPSRGHTRHANNAKTKLKGEGFLCSLTLLGSTGGCVGNNEVCLVLKVH